MLHWLVQQHHPTVDWHELRLDQDQCWNHSEMEEMKIAKKIPLLVNEKQNWKIKMKYSSLLLRRDMETKCTKRTILNMIFH